MNRFVVTKGTLGGGVISAGSTGQTITYDLNGNRATSTDSSSGTTTYTYMPKTGRISTVKIGGVLRAQYIYDAMGRLTDYKEYGPTGGTVKYERTASYNNKSELTQDAVTEVRTDGTWVSTTYYNYNADTNGNGIYTDAGDLYQGGIVTHQLTTTTKNGVSQPTSDTKNSFVWWNSALTNVATFTPDTAHPATVNTSTYSYDTRGNLISVGIVDGRPRTVSFVNTLDGKVLQRDEADNNGSTGDPRELHYYFNGIGVGDVSNNGTSDVDYAASLAEHLVIPGTGPFRDGSPSSTSYADFDQSYDPINGLNYQSTSTRYTVQSGDTLESIAYALWGDAAYWYLIADANGLDGSETLVAGQDLIIPDKIHNVHNNASTYRVYDPNEAIGDTSPTAPVKPKHHGSGCGGFGAIILAVIAIAVTIILPELAPLTFQGFWGAVGAAAIGSVVSQGVGLATGLQSKFSWTSLATSVLSAGIADGLGNLVDVGSKFVNGAINGVITNVATQGIEMAVGLQSKFDWAGVAAAGIGGGVGAEVGDAIGYTPGVRTFDNAALGGVAGMAGGIANAATRSLITGTDFGDNLMQVLPGVIGNTIGNMVAGQIDQPMTQTFTDSNGDTVQYTPSDSSPTPLTEGVMPSEQFTAANGDTVQYTPSDSEPTPLTDAAVPSQEFTAYNGDIVLYTPPSLPLPVLIESAVPDGANGNSVLVTAARDGEGDVSVKRGQRYPVENPGAIFDTKEKAGWAITSKMNDISISEREEYSWGYYKDPNTGKYGYTDPYNEGPEGGRNIPVPITVNGDALDTSWLDGWGHTHGGFSPDFPDGNVGFSSADMEFMRTGGGNRGWDFFTVGVPSNHNLLEWTPTGHIQTLKKPE